MKNRYAYVNSFLFSIIFKIFVLFLTILSLILHIDTDDIPNTFRLFGYFTVITNFFCFVMLIISIYKIIYNKLSFKNYNAVREYSAVFVLFKGMCLMSIILTFFIFHFMVANYKYPLIIDNSLHLPLKDLLAHYLVPLFYSIDWLIFQPKDLQDIRAPFIWTIYPFIYMIITFFRLYQTSKNSYFHLKEAPYFFMDINKFGMERVVIFSIILLFIILCIGYIIIGLEKLLCRIVSHWQLPKLH